jgi:hypothetical protein
VRRILPLLLGLPALLSACALAPGAASGHPAWERIAVIGASASAGFGTELEAGRAVLLAEVVDEALAAPHETPRSFASEMFFLAPEAWGPQQVAEAAAYEPSAVLAVDYLFWFLYGGAPDEEARLALLEGGLASLAPLRGPLVLGEIPDMSAAVGTMLVRSQVPAPDTLARANASLREWAAARPGTAVLRFDPVAGAALVQDDGLHPNLTGLATIAIDALAALPGGAEAAAAGAFIDDPALLADLLRE